MTTSSAITRFWRGPPGLTPSTAVEWRFVVLRWVGVVAVAAALPFVELPLGPLLGALGLLLGAAAYNAAIHYLLPRRPALFASGYLTAAGDCALNVGLLQIVGGFDTPFYDVLFSITIAVSMRHGARVGLGQTGLFVALDLLDGLARRGELGSGRWALRSTFLMMAALLAGYLREQVLSARRALQLRLERAERLNAALEPLNRVRELEPLLEAIRAGACRVAGSEHAVLVPMPGLLPSVAPVPLVSPTPSTRGVAAADREALVATLARLGRDRIGVTVPAPGYWACRLESGAEAVVLPLRPAASEPPFALVAVLAGAALERAPGGDVLSAEEELALGTFADQAAHALEKCRLYEELSMAHRRALHDPLTELPNRLLLRDRLDQAMRAASRSASSMALVVLDLDGFKAVNDTHGHHYGDLLLRVVARRLSDVLRTSDTVGRPGGDEFSIILPGADERTARLVAGKLLDALRVPTVLDGRPVEVGGSFGIATFPGSACDLETLAQQADVAMYAAKRSGGSIVAYAPELEHPGHLDPRRAAAGA